MGDVFRANTGSVPRFVVRVNRQTRAGRTAAVLAPVVLLGTVVGCALAAPAYEWPREAFSVIGGGTGLVALAFNLGLLITGLLTTAYGVFRWRTDRRPTGAVYALGGVALAVAGVFPAGTPLHEIAAVFLFTAWLPPVADGATRWRSGDRTTGAVGVLLGVVAFGVWLPFDLGLDSLWVGYGAAELVTFAAWGAWTAWAGIQFDSPDAGDARRQRPGS